MLISRPSAPTRRVDLLSPSETLPYLQAFSSHFSVATSRPLRRAMSSAISLVKESDRAGDDRELDRLIGRSVRLGYLTQFAVEDDAAGAFYTITLTTGDVDADASADTVPLSVASRDLEGIITWLATTMPHIERARERLQKRSRAQQRAAKRPTLMPVLDLSAHDPGPSATTPTQLAWHTRGASADVSLETTTAGHDDEADSARV